MKILMLSLFTLLGSLSAKADVIRCFFTEPTINTIYDMSTSTLTYGDDDVPEFKVLRNISFHIKSPGAFELVDESGKLLQSLVLNYRGSNGSEDLIYPYHVQDVGLSKSGPALVGGCYSEHLEIKKVK